MRASSFLRLGVLIVAVAVMTGCASQSAQRKSRVSKDYYDYVTVIGSNLRIKVLKGQPPPTLTTGSASMGKTEIHDSFEAPQAASAVEGG
jgi:hypothetical protein